MRPSTPTIATVSNETPTPVANTLFIEVSGAGLPEVDGLFIPSTAPPAESESGTLSNVGFWNGRLAGDRADGKAERSLALSYSNTYKSRRISRLDDHLAYHTTGDGTLPPTDRGWDVYKMGVAPAPRGCHPPLRPETTLPRARCRFCPRRSRSGQGDDV